VSSLFSSLSGDVDSTEVSLLGDWWSTLPDATLLGDWWSTLPDATLLASLPEVSFLLGCS
jgi:hypothetical protein